MTNGIQLFIDQLPVTLTIIAFLTPAYWVYLNSKKRRQNPEYFDAIHPFLWKPGLSLMMITLYLSLAWINDYWNPILNGTVFATSAITFFYLTNHCMNCAMTSPHAFTAPKHLVVTASHWVSLGMTLSVLSLTVVYTMGTCPTALLTLQILLYIASLVTYALVGSTLKLIEIGYVSSDRRQS